MGERGAALMKEAPDNLEWVGRNEDEEIVHSDEPDSNWLLRLRTWRVSPLLSLLQMLPAR
jgi:hypothetical protein